MKDPRKISAKLNLKPPRFKLVARYNNPILNYLETKVEPVVL